MAKVLTDRKHYADIAAAIRVKLGTTAQYKPAEMAAAIGAITASAASSATIPSVTSQIVTTDSQHYADIAAAIRAKNGLSTQYRPAEMAAAVLALITESKHSVTIAWDDLAKGNCAYTIMSGGAEVSDGELLSVRFYSNADRFAISSITATMGGETVDLSSYITKTATSFENPNNQMWLIADLPVTGDLVLTVYAARYLRVEGVAVNGTVAAAGQTVPYAYRQAGGSVLLTFTPASGYEFPDDQLVWDSNLVAWKSGSTEISADALRGLVNLGRASTTTGAINITLNSISQDLTATVTFQAIAAENTYSVVDAGAAYGFALNSSGYYESQNKGAASSAALARIDLNMVEAGKVKISFINYAETQYDYGSFGLLDTELSTSATSDTAARLKWVGNSADKHSASEQIIEYDVPTGAHFILAKYLKDSSVNKNNDSLQFKVEFVETAAPEPGSNTYSVTQESGASYGFALSDGWYVTENTAVDRVHLARINLDMVSAGTVRVTASVAGAQWTDVGFIGLLDTTLATNANFDSSSKLMATLESDYGEMASDYSVSAGEHFIVVKFINLSGVSNAEMKFKVEIL